MVKHIVMFKMKNFKSKGMFDEKVLLIKKELDKLPSKIEVIKSFEVGINEAESPRAYDMVLISEFKNYQDLETYRVHPDHVKVLELVKMNTENTKVVDYQS